MGFDNKFIKNFDFTSTEVKTYLKSLRKHDKNKHKTVHQSQTGAFLTICYVVLMLFYMGYLLNKMYSDEYTKYKS